ncbi:hypothetical protein H696_05453 [Fonticula alba]|uniref:PX domain-containing protein n=1 Tax=Fonticula alba TaxID=691883 RepID=A0A058Z3C4_FONAL|nr:hypothetical protein H696_05453 [Fonticula alba]KCV67987.1 hypothetical protein H696_05453 [Fonticula alba]|eukprot:XP_009497554.1 hypothetical protein H696_05453 [Fonticula alba]
MHLADSRPASRGGPRPPGDDVFSCSSSEEDDAGLQPPEGDAPEGLAAAAQLLATAAGGSAEAELILRGMLGFCFAPAAVEASDAPAGRRAPSFSVESPVSHSYQAPAGAGAWPHAGEAASPMSDASSSLESLSAQGSLDAYALLPGGQVLLGGHGSGGPGAGDGDLDGRGLLVDVPVPIVGPGSREPHQSAFARVSISDPSTDGFTQYSVTTQTNVWSPGTRTVRRRYNDFSLFYEFLLREYGRRVPIIGIPPGRVFQRFEPEFINNRMKNLTLFCNWVVQHPLLRNSPEVQDFFTAEQWAVVMPSPLL